MKKRIVTTLITVAMSATLLLTACGGSTGGAGSDAAAGATEAAAPAEDAAAEGDNTTAELGNPWQEAAETDVYALVGAYFVVPFDATDVTYHVLPSENMGQMDFVLDGLEYTERMKSTTAFEDISGLNYEWDVDEEQSVCGSEGRIRRAVTDSETVDSLLWFDPGMEVMFSLSTSGKDLDGFDIVAIAESNYQPEPEEEFMPGSFVEEAAGKETFESFDELISYLKKDNGYTYLELEGFNGKLLAVTEGTFDDQEGHKAAMDATFYGEVNGAVRFVGNAFSDGTAYPLRCDGKLVYDAGNHRYESEFMTPNGDALMVKDYVSQDYDDAGNVSYSGFLRDDNTSDGDDLPEDPKECEKIFNSLMDAMQEKPVIDFTVVE